MVSSPPLGPPLGGVGMGSRPPGFPQGDGHGLQPTSWFSKRGWAPPDLCKGEGKGQNQLSFSNLLFLGVDNV